MNVIGDVRGKRAIIVDDEIDTAGTLVEIVRALEREGVTEIYACATHGVLSDPAVDRIAASSLLEVVLTDSIPLPSGSASPRSRPFGRAAHRRGHQAHPSRRIGRCALLQRGRPHPGDAPLGGRQRGHIDTREGDAAEGGSGDDDGEPSPGTLLARPRRPMSLQLHRPDGDGGLEPRPVDDRHWRDQLAVHALGHAAPRRAAAGPQEPRDGADVAARCRVAFWAGLGLLTFVILVAGLRHRLLALSPLREGTAGVSPPILGRPMKFFSRFVDSNDREVRRIQPRSTRRTPSSPSPGPLRRRDPGAFAEIRDEIREIAIPEEPSEDERTTRTSSAAASWRRPVASARTPRSRPPSTTSCPRSSR